VRSDGEIRIRKSKEGPQSALAQFFAKAVEMERKGEKIIHLNLGEPYFNTPNHIREAAMRAIKEGFTRYTSPSSLLELREAAAEKLREENRIEVNPDNQI